MSINTNSFSIIQHLNTTTNNNNNAPTINLNQPKLLFQKTLTPSDVGKLNRLVIPKQYAQKYFPLHLHSPSDHRSGDSSSSMLSFEDEMCKIWRFRYSYWTSSQSYVLTKGWNLYVKEKCLNAGDIVSFHRQQSNVSDQRLFIAWRTRLHPIGPKLYCNPCSSGVENMETVLISNTTRKMRLFGVNMEFTESNQTSDVVSDASKILKH